MANQWSKVLDEDTQTYYYWNEFTDETSWEIPDDYHASNESIHRQQNSEQQQQHHHHELEQDLPSPIANNQKNKFFTALEGFGAPPIYSPIPNLHAGNNELDYAPDENIKYYKCQVNLIFQPIIIY